MTANPSNDSGDHASHPSFTDLQRSEAHIREILQSPGLLEFESTVRRHPHYALLKLKEQLTRPPAVVAPSSPQAETEGAWPWASEDLKQKIRNVYRDNPCDAEPSPARRFGAALGALGLGDKLGLNPHREIEKLKTANAALTNRVMVLETKPKRERRKQKFGGRGIKNDCDNWLDRWERDVIGELEKEKCPRNEATQQMWERVYSLASEAAASAINERYRKSNKGKDAVSASSLRRRRDSLMTTNARGEKEKILGEFENLRWAQWEHYRKRKEPEDQLANGSNSPTMEWKDGGGPEQILEGDESETGATTEGGDNRKRSLLDGGETGGLQTMTRRELAEIEIASGCLRKHEGGEGMLHLDDPVDEVDITNDRYEQNANDYLRERGLDPNAVHRPAKGGERRGSD